VQSLDCDIDQERSSIGSVGPAISLPIFDGGRCAPAARRRCRLREAVANYEGTVVQALQDVADAAVSQKALARRSPTDEAVDAAREAWRIQNNRYQAGLSTYLDVLSPRTACSPACVLSRPALPLLRARRRAGARARRRLSPITDFYEEHDHVQDGTASDRSAAHEVDAANHRCAASVCFIALGAVLTWRLGYGVYSLRTLALRLDRQRLHGGRDGAGDACRSAASCARCA
jgi:hypothetical protein